MSVLSGAIPGLAEDSGNPADVAVEQSSPAPKDTQAETQPQTQAETQPQTQPETKPAESETQNTESTDSPSSDTEPSETQGESGGTDTESTESTAGTENTEGESQEPSSETDSEPVTEPGTELPSEVVTEPTTEPGAAETGKEETEKEKETKKDEIKEDAAKKYQEVTGESLYVFGSYPAGNITENTNEIYDYLTDVLGLNHAGACGVLANIQCESNFAATAVGDGGTSYGLCQWHLDRFSALINWCNANGYDFHGIQGQMGYLACELQGGYAGVYQYLLSVPDTAQGAYDAAYYWCKYFEIPANVEYQAMMRADLAMHEYYPQVLGTQEEETETETIKALSEEEMEAVLEEAPETIGKMARLDLSRETAVDHSVELQKEEKAAYRKELEEAAREAVEEALQELDRSKRESEETQPQEMELDASQLARLSLSLNR